MAIEAVSPSVTDLELGAFAVRVIEAVARGGERVGGPRLGSSGGSDRSDPRRHRRGPGEVAAIRGEAVDQSGTSLGPCRPTTHLATQAKIE